MIVDVIFITSWKLWFIPPGMEPPEEVKTKSCVGVCPLDVGEDAVLEVNI